MEKEILFESLDMVKLFELKICTMKIKTFFILGAMILAPRSFLEAGFEINISFAHLREEVEISIEDEPIMVPRKDWDERWSKLKKQYEIPLGQSFSFTISGKTHTRYASRPNYILSENLNSSDELNKIIKGIVIHDMEVEVDSTESDLDQVRRIRDGQITSRGFNDIAYHFVIGSHGTIFICRPENFMGIHAGETWETKMYKDAHLPVWAKGPCPSSLEDQIRKDSVYYNAMRMDPDWGYLGVALCGNFNRGYSSPTLAQLQSLERLLIYLKVKYDIPLCGILFHNQVKKELVEASGLTLKSPKKSCPGENFPDIEFVTMNLPEDSEIAKSKDILCLLIK